MRPRDRTRFRDLAAIGTGLALFVLLALDQRHDRTLDRQLDGAHATIAGLSERLAAAEQRLSLVDEAHLQFWESGGHLWLVTAPPGEGQTLIRVWPAGRRQ